MKHLFLGLRNLANSIRLRMALWYTLMLVIGLALFGGFVYLREAQAVEALSTDRLANRLHQASDFTRRSLLVSGDEESAAPPPVFTLQADEALLVLDTQGKVTQNPANLSSGDSSRIAALLITPKVALPVRTSLALPPSKTAVDYLWAAQAVDIPGRRLGWILLGVPLDPQGQLTRLPFTLLMGIALAALVALLGGYWLADRALSPVKRMARTASEIANSPLDPSDLGRRIQLKGRDELAQLAATFDLMLDRLQAAFQRQRQFTADASHELRTPLTIISLEVDRALAPHAENKHAADRYRSALEVIRSENQFMTRLVAELLTLARMDSGQMTLHREPLDLSDVALEVVERHASLAAQKNIRLIAGDLPEIPFSGDRQYLTQMMSNLVDNAIQYSPIGATDPWVKVETGKDATNHPWVRVTDNGSGIAPEHLEHLFDRFYRVDTARSHNPQEAQPVADNAIPGSGLGLAIVQRIAQVHGGEVSVQSAPGKGSCFTVTFY